MFTQIETSKKQNIGENFYTRFKDFTQFYAKFHLLFLSFLFLQLLIFFLFFSHLSKSATGAFFPATFLLTLFSYLVLLFFFQTKKTTQLLAFQKDFQTAQKAMQLSNLEIAEAAINEESRLSSRELLFYTSNSLFSAIDPLLSKIKIRLHWKNFHSMKELLLLLATKEITSFIKKAPTDLTAHTALAHTYNQLSRLYLVPAFSWIPSDFFSEAMETKFHFFSAKAVEELLVLQEYGMHDVWIHTTLADIYHLQKRQAEEIKECEILLQMLPENEDLLLRIGQLYFQEGYNAKGLKIYEKILTLSSEKAEELISCYGSYSEQEPFFLSTT